MECGCYPVVWWQVELVGNFVDLALYTEWTDVPETQLVAGQMEADVPGRETDLLSQMLYRAVRSLSVGLALVPP